MAEKKFTKRVIQKHFSDDGQLQTIEVKELSNSTENIASQEVELEQQNYYSEEANNSNQNTEVIVQSQGTVSEGVAAIDLMNFKLVRFEEGDGQLGGHFRLVSNTDDQQIMTTINGEDVLYVSSDTIDIEHITKSDDSDDLRNGVANSLGQETKYVQLQMEGCDVPIVMQLACDPTTGDNELSNPTKLKPLQQKQFFKNNFSNNVASTRGGRRTLPPAQELLSSPNFKLFLYSCKQCDYQCNAIKDLTKHRMEKHGTTSRNRNSSSWSVRSSATRKPDLSPYPAGQTSTSATQKL